MKRHHPNSASAKLQLTQRAVKPRTILSPSESSVDVQTGSVLGPQALNTHFFDGKMGNLISKCKYDIERVAPLHKSEGFLALWNKINLVDSPLKTRNVLRCLELIISSYQEHGREKISPNYDPANNLFACDLLYLLYEKICLEGSEEHLAILLTQLDEMATGTCPQGRTTRLFQILIMLRDDIDC